MTPLRLLAIIFITGVTGLAWFILGGALSIRSAEFGASSDIAVREGWGPPLVQAQPKAWHEAPGTQSGRKVIRPAASEVEVDLQWEPRRKGLVWFRAYGVRFRGDYSFTNPAPIPQTIYVQFELPSAQASYSKFAYQLNGQPTSAQVSGGQPIVEAINLEPGGEAKLAVSYETRGLDRWAYSFGEESRVENFALAMTTDFHEVDFPTASPTERQQTEKGWNLFWNYPDEIGARSATIDLPKVLNPGPVASRIAFFAPVSLVFFFSVLVILCLLRGVDLHPMNFFFLAAGCFAFQLLFAYLVDLLPLGFSFAVSAAVSLVLVSGYLTLAKGWKFARLAALAQLIYMVLFSYSFFFDGLTGLTITIGAILTLAALMVATAKINWSERLVGRGGAPVINRSV